MPIWRIWLTYLDVRVMFYLAITLNYLIPEEALIDGKGCKIIRTGRLKNISDNIKHHVDGGIFLKTKWMGESRVDFFLQNQEALAQDREMLTKEYFEILGSKNFWKF